SPAVRFRHHGSGVLRVFFAAFIAMVNTTFQVFALNFATSDAYGIGISSTLMLWLAIVGQLRGLSPPSMLGLPTVATVLPIATTPFWARLSARVARKPVFVSGLLGSAVLVV